MARPFNEETLKAARLVTEEGMTMYAAAKATGVPESTLIAHFARDRQRKADGVVHCPCCGNRAKVADMDQTMLSAVGRKAIRREAA